MSRVRGISGLDRPSVQWTFAACVIVLIAAGAAMAVGMVRERRAVAAARAETLQARLDRDRLEDALSHERATRESLQLELGRERRTAADAPSVPTLTLSPVVTRSPAGPDVAVPRTSAPVVDLRLILPRGAAAAAYSVTLRSWSTGAVLLARAGLTRTSVDGKPAVTARIASDVLAPGAYEAVLIEGSAPGNQIATYGFAVE